MISVITWLFRIVHGRMAIVFLFRTNELNCDVIVLPVFTVINVHGYSQCQASSLVPPSPFAIAIKTHFRNIIFEFSFHFFLCCCCFVFFMLSLFHFFGLASAVLLLIYEYRLSKLDI